MDISILIVNWNTRDLLRNCLRSIQAGAGGLAVQTIVVDNNSRDGSREMVQQEFPQVVLVNAGGNVGFARGNNRGLAEAKAPLILFLNPDTELVGDALSRMVGFLRGNPPVGAVGCKIRDASGEIQELGLQWVPSPWTELVKSVAVSTGSRRWLARWLPHHDPRISGYITKLYGSCLLVRAAVLEQVGTFDERFFMYCEDVDLCRRIQVAGWKLYYLSEAEILHLGGGASAGAPGAFAVLMACESFSRLMRKYHGRWGSATYRLLTLVGAQFRLALLLLRGLALAVGLRGDRARLDASIRKYVVITQWTLGLRRAVVGE